MKMTRTLIAGVAAATLSFGMVACSQAEDAANEATEVATKATDAAGDAADKAGDKAGDAADKAGDKASEATEAMDSDAEGEGETQEATLADGSTVMVPADLATAMGNQEGEWGQAEAVEEYDNGTLVTYPAGHYLVFSEANGAVPVHGKIGETWMAEGGMDSEIGLPTAPEKEIENGWTQSFENQVIDWVKAEGASDYAAEFSER